jgi:hypothetical protein
MSKSKSVAMNSWNEAQGSHAFDVPLRDAGTYRLVFANTNEGIVYL